MVGHTRSLTITRRPNLLELIYLNVWVYVCVSNNYFLCVDFCALVCVCLNEKERKNVWRRMGVFLRVSIAMFMFVDCAIWIVSLNGAYVRFPHFVSQSVRAINISMHVICLHFTLVCFTSRPALVSLVHPSLFESITQLQLSTLISRQRFFFHYSLF